MRKTRTSIDRTTPPRVPLPFWAWSVVAVFCIVLYTASVPVNVDEYELDLVVVFVISTVQCGSLILAIFRPRLGAALHLLAVVAMALVTRDALGEAWPLPITGLISLGFLILLLGIRERWTVSVSTWWLSLVVLIVIVSLTPARFAVSDEWSTNLTIYASYSVLVLVASIAIGQRRRIRADLATAQRDVELEQAHRLYAEERARIARELHDVVAHSMSIIHMQAMSAPIRLRDADRETVDEEFGHIAISARTALGEMRQLLGALRSEHDDADLAPQPQLSDIPDLADSTSRAGLDVEVAIDAESHSASPIVQLTIYRIVQEALSNVVRHASGASTTVAVTAERTSLRVIVTNGAPPHSDPSSTSLSHDSGGQGLRGMRERVNLLAGQLTTLPTADGGYVVDAHLPAALEKN